jgi:hypothetical protein
MAETLVERRFVAVLAGEIVDYSRLLERRRSRRAGRSRVHRIAHLAAFPNLTPQGSIVPNGWPLCYSVER